MSRCPAATLRPRPGSVFDVARTPPLSPGGEVIGKTGTAEWVNDQGELRLHSWVMVAQDDIVVAVFVEDGSYGSRTAGPIAHAMLEKINGVA